MISLKTQVGYKWFMKCLVCIFLILLMLMVHNGALRVPVYHWPLANDYVVPIHSGKHLHCQYLQALFVDACASILYPFSFSILSSSSIVRLLAGLYLAYTLPPMTLSDTHILCMIRHAETMLQIFFNECPRKGLVITWKRLWRFPKARLISFLDAFCQAV